MYFENTITGARGITQLNCQYKVSIQTPVDEKTKKRHANCQNQFYELEVKLIKLPAKLIRTEIVTLDNHGCLQKTIDGTDAFMNSRNLEVLKYQRCEKCHLPNVLICSNVFPTDRQKVECVITEQQGSVRFPL